MAEGAQAIVVSESFGVDDVRGERIVLEAAADLGVPACAGHEITGVYGLELRTVTAALNASILPTGAAAPPAPSRRPSTQRVPGVPLLVMRGDGGAASIDSMRRRPLQTAFSGPAASVAGALHHLSLTDALVVEVGGTSTNVSVVARRTADPVLRPRAATTLPACGASTSAWPASPAAACSAPAGELGRRTVAGVGPRSAHIAGLTYASFTDRPLAGARVVTAAPRPGDPADYLLLETPDGTRVAPTLTCAANALGTVPPATAAVATDPGGRGDRLRAARRGARSCRVTPWRRARSARRPTASRRIVRELIAEHGVAPRSIGRARRRRRRARPRGGRPTRDRLDDPPDAEVDLVDRRRAVDDPRRGRAGDRGRLGRGGGPRGPEAEAEAVAAGAAPDTVQIETVSLPERSTMRAVALGAVAFEGTATELVAEDVRRDAAVAVTGSDPLTLARDEFYSVFGARAGDDEAERPVAVVDRWGAVAWSGACRPVTGPGDELAIALPAAIVQLARRVGPVTVAPSLVLLRGARLIDLGLFSKVDALTEAAVEECRIAGTEPVIALFARAR